MSKRFYKVLAAAQAACVVVLIMTTQTTLTAHASIASAGRLSDQDVLDATERAATGERRATAELIALLAEIDARKLYLGAGYSSLYTYCRYQLRLSEFAAYGRIEAARLVRRFPMVLDRLAEGAVTLTSVGLLAPYLTDDNHEALLDAVQHASKRDVERLIASLYGQPDIPPSVRRLSDAKASATLAGSVVADASAAEASASEPALASPSTPVSPTATNRRDTVAPLAVGRYLLRVTIGAETHARLDKARDLLRHAVPDGDLATVLDRALAVLVDQLERRKTGRASRPKQARAGQTPAHPRGRHVPSAVKREVWTRDEGRCAFVGTHGRCRETGRLEYHHKVPYARGGATNASNLELRCRAHNAYEAERDFPDFPDGDTR